MSELDDARDDVFLYVGDRADREVQERVVERFERAVAEDVLHQAAVELRHKASLRFDEHGPHDVRGAAIWDSGCHIAPNENQWRPS